MSNNIVAINKTAPVNAIWTPQQMTLMQNTVAKDCNTSEFDMFLHVCAHVGLDPLRRQIYAFVFNKDKPDRRNMAIVTAIAGLRTIADRTGNYMPDANEPVFEFDDAAKSPTNPHGIVSCCVTVNKHAHGAWFPVKGKVYWDEFAPISEEWDWRDDDRTGKRVRRPTGKKILDGKWSQMPKHMLAKCAEALALRKAWPDEIGNVYEETEFDKLRAAETIELSPSEYAEQARVAERLAMIGGANSIMFDFGDGLEHVPLGQCHDRIAAHFRTLRSFEIAQFEEQNREPLKEFWARAKADALQVKALIETARKAMEQEESKQ